MKTVLGILKSTSLFCAEYQIKSVSMMNKTKLKVYKRVHQDVCEKFDEAEQFINKKIKEKRFSLLLKKLKKIKLSVKEVIYFVYESSRFVASFLLALKLVVCYKTNKKISIAKLFLFAKQQM